LQNDLDFVTLEEYNTEHLFLGTINTVSTRFYILKI